MSSLRQWYERTRRTREAEALPAAKTAGTAAFTGALLGATWEQLNTNSPHLPIGSDLLVGITGIVAARSKHATEHSALFADIGSAGLAIYGYRKMGKQGDGSIR